MSPGSAKGPAGPLRPLELATAAVLGGATVVVSVLGWLLPHASVIQVLGAVPMGVVAHRHRPRALLAATVAASLVAFLVAGGGPVYSVVGSALVGGSVGEVRRRGRGPLAAAAVTAVVGPLVAAGADAMLWLFSSARTLTLDQIRNTVHGVTGLMARVPGVEGLAANINQVVDALLREWWVTVPVLVVAGFASGVLAAWVLLGAVLERLAWMAPEDRLDAPDDPRPPAPVPVSLTGVRFRYPSAPADALCGVDLEVAPGEMLAVVGPNGSGKSTLARVLAGRPPTSGTVTRPGSPGLGRPGGTAMVAQRPESQVLGVRVADDVVWGLPPGVAVDVDGLLGAVGLAGLGSRETTTLSGGQLQRLAVAAALARHPALLVSDESTAMIDAAGRVELVGLLAGLPASTGTTVVHITHRLDEAASADRLITLGGGRVVADTPAEPAREPREAPAGRSEAPPPRRPPGGGETLVELRGVSHTYAAGTPWAHQALQSVDLTVGGGEGLLVVGGNGSGKTTLAWVVAGLLVPTGGECLVEGRPADERLGAVALAFQHARLQLQRPTAGEDIRAAAGRSGIDPVEALDAVGLPPELAGRRVDELSGGQMRRVALAGLLAGRPRVLILDEPLAGLDPESRQAVLAALAAQRRAGLTLVVISHDLEGVGEVCDRAVRLEGGRLAGAAPLPAAAVGL